SGSKLKNITPLQRGCSKSIGLCVLNYLRMDCRLEAKKLARQFPRGILCSQVWEQRLPAVYHLSHFADHQVDVDEGIGGRCGDVSIISRGDVSEFGFHPRAGTRRCESPPRHPCWRPSSVGC